MGETLLTITKVALVVASLVFILTAITSLATGQMLSGMIWLLIAGAVALLFAQLG